MRIYTIVIIICFLTKTYGQSQTLNKLDLMQGIWENNMNEDSNKAFKIIIGKYSLDFTLLNDPNELNFPLFEMIIGFQNFDSSDETLSIKIDDLKAEGLYFTEIIDKKYIEKDGSIKKPNYLIPFNFECNGDNMAINGGKLFEYHKINKLPVYALKLLYNRKKKDQRDYIKEYLNIKVAEITAPKSTVYSEPNKPTATQLSKGDVVTMLEEKGNWLKVDYGADTPGWVKKEDSK